MKLLRPARASLLASIVAVALVPISSPAAEQPLPAGIRIPVMLTKSIGTKLALGAPVEAETTSQVKLPASLGVIPKGTRITGHISLAMPYDKKESRLALVLERVETKSAAFRIRAFIVGKLRARNSVLGRGPGAAYLEGTFPRTDNTVGHVPVTQQIPVDQSCKLVQSDNPEIGSEVVSRDRDVAMDIGTTFDVLTVED